MDGKSDTINGARTAIDDIHAGTGGGMQAADGS